MKLAQRMGWGLVVVLACALAAFAADKADKKEKAAPGQVVDSGSFGVFIKGQRVVTETFSVHQGEGNSSIRSELKETAGSSPTDQKSNLEITGNGELLRYDWSEAGPEGGSLMVVPKDEFLVEKITATTSAKAAEQPFLMPNTSMILDNNFFVHREVLAWRYLKDDCKAEGGTFKCQKQPAEFGVLVPQDRTSMRVRIELMDKDRITIRGVERALLRLRLSGEAFEWFMWVDDSDRFKLMRVSIPADSTEVVRD